MKQTDLIAPEKKVLQSAHQELLTLKARGKHLGYRNHTLNILRETYLSNPIYAVTLIVSMRIRKLDEKLD